MMLSLTLFSFWTFVGLGLLAVFPARLRALTNLLLAPAVGVALTVICVFLVNRWGVPVCRMAFPLTGGLGLMALVALLRRRPFMAWKLSWPYLLLLLVNLALVGRPLLTCGFDWISFCNGDMLYYSLGATRFADHGFFDVPLGESLLAGRDLTEWCWFDHVPGLQRAGSELVLAWVMSLTGLNAHQVFMPVIVALNLVLLGAAGALMYSSTRSWQAALLTTALLCVSAQMAVGVYYQLIAQVGGLALLCANLTVFLRPGGGRSFRAQRSPAVLAAVLLTAQLIVYPEVLPFLGAGYACHQVLRAWRRQLAWKASAGWHLVVGLIVLILANRTCVDAFDFLLAQARRAAEGQQLLVNLFPYYMLPIGFSNLWGFQRLSSYSPEPWQSLSIAVGFLLLLATAGYAFRLAWRGNAHGLATVVMLVLAVYLYFSETAFGLFKLVLYIQPFLLGCFALLCLRPGRWARLALLPLALFVVTNLGVLANYSRLSERSESVSEIPHASQIRISASFRDEVQSKRANHLVFDTDTVCLAKLLALHTRGIRTEFLSTDVYFTGNLGERSSLGLPPFAEECKRLLHAGRSVGQKAVFDLQDPERVLSNSFKAFPAYPEQVESTECAFLVRTPADLTVFNRRHTLPATNPTCWLQPLEEVRNHLVFTPSELGLPYYTSKLLSCPDRFAFSQTEGDYFFHGRSMEAVGRHLLFQVVRPTPRVRLLLDFSASLKANGQNRLPETAVVIGQERVALGMSGRGAARVVSPPCTPRMIDGRPYLALDLGEAGTRFPSHHTGLNTLWGQHICDDRRQLVGFARDISLLTEEEYDNLKPPAQLTNFPTDLANPGLQFSGIYEDGWVGESVWLVLSQSPGQELLVVEGTVWAGGEVREDGNEITVLVGGQVLSRKTLRDGTFALRLPVPAGSGGTQKVELRFRSLHSLPAPDNRPVSAQIKRLGFVSNP